MSSDLEILLEKLDKFTRMEYTSVFFSQPVSSAPPRDFHPRIVFIEKGDPLLLIGCGKENHNVRIPCGSAVYGVSGSSTGISVQPQECTTFAVCFFPEYIRLVTYDFHADGKDAQILHLHTFTPLPFPGRMILETLNHLAKQPDANECSHFLIRALLQMTAALLKSAQNNKNIGKSARTWNQIEKYLEAHLEEELSRKEVAAAFRMNQSYLSILCRRHTGKKFNEYVRDLRLTQAALLLELNLSLDEISERCGFCYTSYFIRLFKAHYGISPGKFRLH